MQNFLHINGLEYDAKRVMEELVDDIPAWKVKGLEFLIQMLDPSEAPVKFNTSGTTGKPKEISFTKQQIWLSAKNTNHYFKMNEATNMLLCLPANFVAGRMMIARALLAEANLVWVEPSLNPLKDILNIDFAAFTPAQVATILDNPHTKKVFQDISKIIIGGGEISHSLENELMGYQNEIYATYGMTETLTHVAVRKIGESLYHSVFDDGTFSLDENNCLVIEIPSLTDEKMITKDIVELMDQKSFIWKGRFDHVINSGGIKLYPEELEKKLLVGRILDVFDFYITSKQDNIFGEVPVIVMLKSDMHADVATFLPRINGLLNKHEAVKHVVFLDKFERTETGKIKRLKF